MKNILIIAVMLIGMSLTANANNWQVKHYVDEFGDKTGESYITTKKWVKGTFSNSATTNSKLNVKILIDADDIVSVSIKLFEYASNNCVKAYGIDEYSVSVKCDGIIHSFNARNHSDRLSFGKGANLILHKFLLSNKPIKFAIKESDGTSSYSFQLKNIKNYKKAFNGLN
jgi:hypothetical protein